MKKKPIETMMYKCPFCKDRVFDKKFDCTVHVRRCDYNPENMCCPTCRHWGEHQELLKEKHESEEPCYLRPHNCFDGSRWELVKDEYFEEVQNDT